MNTDKENGKMNYHDTMRFVGEEGKSMNMDRCSFCTRMESLSEHGKCSHFDTDYVGKDCSGFLPVSDVGKRVRELMASQKLD